MIPTLKGTNGSNMAVGNIQVQPVLADISYTVQKQSTTSNSTSSPATLPAHQATLNVTVMVHESSSLKTIKAPTLGNIASSIALNPKFVVPGLSSKTALSPTYAIKLMPVVIFNPALLDTLTVSTKKFEPYEALTGVSQDRPEILMLTEFLPVFDKIVSRSSHGLVTSEHAYMTDAGKYIDAQIQLRNLRFSNVANLLKNLKARYPVVANEMLQRSSTFQSELSELQQTSSFLLDLVRNVDRLKQQLDVRADIHIVDPQSMAREHVINFTRASNVSTSKGLIDTASKYLPASYDITDVMVRMGYNHDSVKNSFASTKVWLQMLLELRDMTRAHSLEFLDVQPVQQEADDNGAVLVKSNVKLFAFNTFTKGLPSVKELISLNVKEVTAIASTVEQEYLSTYQGVSFKTDEARIAMLAHTVAREYRFSQGLASPDVVKALSDYYAYKPVPSGNIGVFDAVFGRFGNNISDIPSAQSHDLASLSQQQPAENVALLTFESKYLEGDTGTLTPGAAYYVDNMMQTTDGKTFDTSRLTSLALLLENANKQLNVVVNGMNMLSSHVASVQDQSIRAYETLLGNPNDLLNTVLSQLVGTSGSPLSVVTNDRLTSVYALAGTDNNLKSLLMMLTLARMTRTYTVNIPNFSTPADNTALVDALVDQVVSALVAAAKQTTTGVFFVRNKIYSLSTITETLTQDAIRSALRQGTPLTNLIETTMSKSLASFLLKAVGEDERTRYTGCLDTTVMMFLFDMVVSLISKYGNQTIVGAQPGTTQATKNSMTFTVAKASLNYQNSIRDVTNRLTREAAFVQQGLYAVMNSLKKLSGAARGLVNYLTAPSTLQKLTTISNVLEDPTLFHLLLSKQQVLALSATVNDLLDQVNNFNVGSSVSTAAGAAAQIDNEIRSLDDSVMTPPLADAFYGLFSDQEYATSKGFNKKIMTVGVPLGFTTRMKQVVNISKLKKSSFVNKQEDIVKVVVYKVDLENSDIIYKPLTYLFEMSRFPVRNSNTFLSVPGNPTIEDVVAAIPTRDIAQNSNDSAGTIDYMSTKDADVSKLHNVAFDDPSYDFLSQRQKFEILQNHVTSYMLEVYIRLMTGLNVADNQFNIVEPPNPVGQDFVQLITQHQMAHIADNAALARVNVSAVAKGAQPLTGGVMFRTTSIGSSPTSSEKAGSSGTPRTPNNSSGRSGNVNIMRQFQSIPTANVSTQSIQQQSVPSLEFSMSRMTARNTSQVMHDLRTISNAARMIMPVSDPVAIAQQLIKPKQFDRVFNVIVDPDDFEVDYGKTTATPQGKQALEQMIKRGDILVVTPGESAQGSTAALNFGLNAPRDFVQGHIEPNVNKYRFRTRDKNEGDLAFEKYIVTVESFDEEEV